MTNTAALKTGKAPKAVTNLSEDNKIAKMYKKIPSTKNVEGIFSHNRISKCICLFKNESR